MIANKLDTVKNAPFSVLVWFLPFALMLHELEEWNIMAWYQEQFHNPPSTFDYVAQTFLVSISIFGFVFTGFVRLFDSQRMLALITLAVFSPILLGNAMQHIYWSFAFKAYAPGVISSVLLSIPTFLFLSWHAVTSRLTPLFYLCLLYLFSFYILYSTILSGRTVLGGLESIHRFSAWLAQTLGIGP